MPTQRDIEVEFWTSPAVVSATPATKLFFLYLLCGPQTNYIGIYRFSVETCMRDTGLSRRQVQTAIQFGRRPQETVHDPFLIYTESCGLMFIVKRLSHTFRNGQRPNERQCKGIRRMLEVLPRCDVLKVACERYRELGSPFADMADRIQTDYKDNTPPDTPPDTPMHTPQDTPPDRVSTELETQPRADPPDPVLGPRSSVSGPQKNRKPDAAAGASGDISDTENGKGTGTALKDVLDTSELKARADMICGGIEKLPRKVVAFHPWQCLQRMVNGRLPVGIGLKILLELRDRWPKIDHPWKYVQTVLDREHMALHIRLMEAEHQATKNQRPNLQSLGTIMRGIGEQTREPPADPQPEEGDEAFS